MRIVTDVPPRSWVLRTGRGLIVLLGFLLLMAGLLVAVPALALVVLVPWATFSGDEVEASAWLPLAVSVLGTLVLTWLGLRLMRGRRHLVLFLRRFGFDDASAALTLAVNGALGRRWRLVTLDDSEIQAVGVRRASRFAWGLGRRIALALLVAAIWYAANWWLGGGTEQMLDGIFDSAFADAETSGQDAFAAIFGAIVVGVVVGAVVLSTMLLFGIIGISLLGVASLGLWQGDRAVRRAEEAKALMLRERFAIAPTVDRIRGYAGRIQSPRLIVLKVHDSIWRDVVIELANDASVALIDVSDPTEHLLWEVALLQGDVNARMVAVGRRDRVEALAVAEGDDPAGRLRVMLAGEDVLIYDAGLGRRASQRFARSLAATFDRTDLR